MRNLCQARKAEEVHSSALWSISCSAATGIKHARSAGWPFVLWGEGVPAAASARVVVVEEDQGRESKGRGWDGDEEAAGVVLHCVRQEKAAYLTSFILAEFLWSRRPAPAISPRVCVCGGWRRGALVLVDNRDRAASSVVGRVWSAGALGSRCRNWVLKSRGDMRDSGGVGLARDKLRYVYLYLFVHKDPAIRAFSMSAPTACCGRSRPRVRMAIALSPLVAISRHHQQTV